MKIQNIKVRGAIGFKKGLGLDEINIDISGLSGLIALSGKNGKGKTTLLESLSPFRTFASRAGALRHHFFLRDSYRDLKFLYDGDTYRTLLKIDAESDRSEGFIWKNGEPQVDGKVRQYDNYLTGLLGTANLFYNSVFCAQNSAGLSDMTTGQLKQLFAEFLRLERLTAYENTSKKCISLLEGMRLQTERNIHSLEIKIKQFGDIDRELERINDNRTQLEWARKAEKDFLIAADSSVEKLQKTLTQNKINIERLHDIKKNIASAITERGAKQQEFDKQLNDIRSDQLIIVQKISALNDILKNERQIRAAAAAVTDIEKEISTTVKRMEETQAAGMEISEKVQQLDNSALAQQINDVNRDYDQLRHEKAEAEALNSRLISEIKACNASMSLLDKRDPLCTSDTCSFIVSALKAQKELPVLEKQGHEITDKINSLEQTIANNRMTLKKLTDRQDAERKSLEKQRTVLQEKWKADRALLEKKLRPAVEKNRMVAEKLPQLEIAGEKLKDLTAKKEELKNRFRSIDEELHRYIQNNDSLLHELEGKKNAIGDKIQVSAEQDFAEAQKRKEIHARAIESMDAEIAALSERASIVKQRLSEKETAQKELIAGKTEYDKLKVEIQEWTYLKNACGKNGLQALEIDGVAPLITGYANNLLNNSFGPNFSVKLITQDPESGREVLDIIVIRSDGSETELEKLSGGEKVWILKSLRLAMTLVSKEKSGRNFESLFCDEEDGPLDVEKAMSFAGLYRSMLDVGNFKDCFYISHNPDVVAMADHHINLSDSCITIK